MNTPTRYFFTFGFIGFIYSLLRIDPIILFGVTIVYPRILDVLFLAIGGYAFAYIQEQERDESRPGEKDMFDSFILGMLLVVAFIINIALYTIIPTVAYVYVVCGIVFVFGLWIAYIGFDSKLDQNEIFYLLMVGSLIALGFGLVVGGGFLALLYVFPPITIIGTKQLFSRK